MSMSMQEADLRAFQALPPSTMCRIISFDTADVVPGFFPKTFFLIVRGTKLASVTAELVPLLYFIKPDYWGIEVVGCQRGFGIQLQVPYVAVLDISHYLGNHGIEVIGANKKQKIKVP
jgi:hypothetical protein